MGTNREGTGTHEVRAAAVACVLFDAPWMVLGNVLRYGETVRAAGEEENGRMCAGLVLEQECMASFEGRKDIILAAIMKVVCLLAIGRATLTRGEMREMMTPTSGRGCRKAGKLSSPIIGAV